MVWMQARCDSNACVRVSVGARTVWIGDSADDPAGVVRVLSVDRAAWAEFVDAVKSGRLS